MAKSKSGGTRSMLRGRVGSDVYSVGRDAKGKRQQVVRSLAETVANPQTINQMRGRMIMSTIMQAQSALKPIIDHSFDNVSGVQPNLSEFIARNYAKIKADIAANPASGNAFGLVKSGEKGAKQGAYIIADGQAVVPAALALTKTTAVIAITLPSDAVTMAGLKSVLGLGAEEYFTLVGINTNGGAEYERFHINQDLADTTAISSTNLAQIFNVEGNAQATLAIASNVISITLSSIANCCAVIVTKKDASGFKHSKATLGSGTSLDFSADVALATYPIGENKFLNGGSESFSYAAAGNENNNSGGGSSSGGSETPSVATPVISGTTPFDDSTEVTIACDTQGATIYYTQGGTTPTTSSSVYSSAITLTSSTTIKAIAVKDGVSSEVATKTFTKSGGTGGDGLDQD